MTVKLEELKELVKDSYMNFLKDPGKLEKKESSFFKRDKEDSNIGKLENQYFENAKKGSRQAKETVYKRLERIIENEYPIVNESTIDNFIKQSDINYYENLYYDVRKDKNEDFDNCYDLKDYTNKVDKNTYNMFVKFREKGLFKPSEDTDIIEYFEQFRIKETSSPYIEKLNRLVKIIYQSIWGFGIIEDFVDKIVNFNEIGINRFDYIWIQFNGKKRPLKKIKFESQDEYERVIKNLGRNNGNGDINEANAADECSLLDMQRISIISHPFVRPGGQVVRIRNQTLKKITLEEMVIKKSISPKFYEFIHLGKKGRPNIGVFGGQGIGKTTLINALLETTPYDRVQATQESTLELYSDLRYPLKNIVGFQSLGIDPGELYKKKLRMGLDHDHYGEIRTPEDAYWAKQTMTRQARGSYFTVHYSDPYGCIEGLAELICTYLGFNDYRYMRYAVAKMVNFLIQPANNNVTGKYYVKNVYEIIPDSNDLSFKIEKIFEYNDSKEELEAMKCISEYTKEVFRDYNMSELELEEIEKIFE